MKVVVDYDICASTGACTQICQHFGATTSGLSDCSQFVLLPSTHPTQMLPCQPRIWDAGHRPPWLLKSTAAKQIGVQPATVRTSAAP